MKVITSKENLQKTINELKERGFVWVYGDPSAAEIIGRNKNTRYFVIDCFYNIHTRKNEMQYESEKFYKKHDLI